MRDWSVQKGESRLYEGEPMTILFFASRQDSEPPMSSTGAKAEEPGRAVRPTISRQYVSSTGTNLQRVLSRCH